MTETPEHGTYHSRYDEGLTIRKNVMGEDYVARALSTAEGTDSAALQHHITDTVWGAVWGRPGLDDRSRSLLSALLGPRNAGQSAQTTNVPAGRTEQW